MSNDLVLWVVMALAGGHPHSGAALPNPEPVSLNLGPIGLTDSGSPLRVVRNEGAIDENTEGGR